MHRNREKRAKTEGRPSGLQSGFHIEADRILSTTSVSISNVLSIIDFKDETAILKMRKGKIKIVGEELAISIYENKIVEIKGKVRNIELL